MKKVIVVFEKHWRGYSPTEKAGFAELEAKALVDKGIAQYHKGGKPKQEKQPAPEPVPPADTTSQAAAADGAAGADDDKKP